MKKFFAKNKKQKNKTKQNKTKKHLSQYESFLDRYIPARTSGPGRKFVLMKFY